MSTILVFLLTLIQFSAVVVSIIVPIKPLFDTLVVYGSPMFFIMNSLGKETVAFEPNIIFPLLAVFHVIKYVALARSQFGEDRRSLHIVSVIMEIMYLAVCAYHLP